MNKWVPASLAAPGDQDGIDNATCSGLQPSAPGTRDPMTISPGAGGGAPGPYI